MKRITLFSFGYYGWGNATPQLIKAADAIERRRGFKPPIFVDTRFQRSGRAVGFIGSAFEDLLGSRYEWMKSLGNKRIKTRRGKAIQIARPEAVNELLDLAVKANKEKRRSIFFCGCLWAKEKGNHKCHRSVIADMLVEAAKDRKVPVLVVEWPGDERRRVRLELKKEQFRAVRRRAMFIPMPGNVDIVEIGGLPWGSIITFSCGNESIHRLVGPLIWRNRGWYIQVLYRLRNPKASIHRYEALAQKKVLSLGPEGYETR